MSQSLQILAHMKEHFRHTMNLRNSRLSKANKTGVKGIHYDKERGRWDVRIGIGNGKLRRVGRFFDFFEACCARISAENNIEGYVLEKKRRGYGANLDQGDDHA